MNIDRRAWLTFDVIGMLTILIGALTYVGIPMNIGEIPSLIIFAMGLVFIVIGAVFGHMESTGVRKELLLMMKERNVRDAADAVPDDSDKPYVINMAEEWKKPLESEVDLDDLMGRKTNAGTSAPPTDAEPAADLSVEPETPAQISEKDTE